MQKRIPLRQCVACREKKEKRALARIVRAPSGEVMYDIGGRSSGRGAYICKSSVCLEKAIKIKALSRALECEIPIEQLERLREQFKEGEGANG